MWCLVIYQTGETPKTFGNTSDRLLLVWNWQSKFFVNKFMLSLAYDNEKYDSYDYYFKWDFFINL